MSAFKDLGSRIRLIHTLYMYIVALMRDGCIYSTELLDYSDKHFKP